MLYFALFYHTFFIYWPYITYIGHTVPWNITSLSARFYHTLRKPASDADFRASDLITPWISLSYHIFAGSFIISSDHLYHIMPAIGPWSGPLLWLKISHLLQVFIITLSGFYHILTTWLSYLLTDFWGNLPINPMNSALTSLSYFQ